MPFVRDGGKFVKDSNGKFVVNNNKPISQPLYFTPNEVPSGIILSMSRDDGYRDWVGSYSTDGINWISYEFNKTNMLVFTELDQRFYFKGVYVDKETQANPDYLGSVTFRLIGSMGAHGNVMSMCCGDNYSFTDEVPVDEAFLDMFHDCDTLTSVPDLPATKLSKDCYRYMFSGCTSLYISDERQKITDYEWKIPKEGKTEEINPEPSEYIMDNMFYGCKGIRSTDSPDFSNTQKTYYVNYEVQEDTELCIILDDIDRLADNQNIWISSVGNPQWSGYYSYDRINWIPYELNAEIPMENEGDKVYIKGIYTSANDENNYISFSGNAYGYSVSGNIMSLCSGDDYKSTKEIPYNYCFYKLFDESRNFGGELRLSATILTQNCYQYMLSDTYVYTYFLPASYLPSHCYDSMFLGNRSLYYIYIAGKFMSEYCCYKMFYKTEIRIMPNLPSTNLAPYCYGYMFYDCDYLTETIDILPATILYEGCYFHMFELCSNLTKAPQLPAVSITKSAYASMFAYSGLLHSPVMRVLYVYQNGCAAMFYGCSKLLDAPDLEANDLWSSCYASMFRGCTSLVDPPKILATLAHNDYVCADMFRDCTSLLSTPELFIEIAHKEVGVVVSYIFLGMFQNCTSLKFVRPIHTSYIKPDGFNSMFENCRSLIMPPVILATNITSMSHNRMFYGCSSLQYVPNLPGKPLGDRYSAQNCYQTMFYNCTSLYISDSQSAESQYAWNIPSSGTMDAFNSGYRMFVNCLGTRSSDHLPYISGTKTYYTQNKPVGYIENGYTITYNLTRCVPVNGLIYIEKNGAARINFIAYTQYTMDNPEITVTGASYSYNNGELYIYNFTSNIVITISAVTLAQYNITYDLSYCSVINPPSTIRAKDNISIEFNNEFDIGEYIIDADNVENCYFNYDDNKFYICNPYGEVKVICKPSRPVHNIITNLTHTYAYASNPTHLPEWSQATLHFEAEEGYKLPDNIEITGLYGFYYWYPNTGELDIYWPDVDVNITIESILI